MVLENCFEWSLPVIIFLPVLHMFVCYAQLSRLIGYLRMNHTSELCINVSLSLLLMACSDGPNDNACFNYSKSVREMLGQMVGGKRRRNDNTSYGPCPPGRWSDVWGQITRNLYVMCVTYMCSWWFVCVCTETYTLCLCCVFLGTMVFKAHMHKTPKNGKHCGQYCIKV